MNINLTKSPKLFYSRKKTNYLFLSSITTETWSTNIFCGTLHNVTHCANWERIKYASFVQPWDGILALELRIPKFSRVHYFHLCIKLWNVVLNTYDIIIIIKLLYVQSVISKERIYVIVHYTGPSLGTSHLF